MRLICRTRSWGSPGRLKGRLFQIVCSQPPEGYEKWILRLLADKLPDWRDALAYPMEPEWPRCYGYEYELLGAAVNFMVTEPLTGLRKVNVRDTRRAVDLVQEIKGTYILNSIAYTRSLCAYLIDIKQYYRSK